MTIPYIHEAKCSDIRRVSVSYESHQLFPGQFKSKQFVKETEGSGHDTTSPNSSHLQKQQRHTPKSIISWGKPLNMPLKENHTVGISKGHNNWFKRVHVNPSYFKAAGGTEEDGN